MVGVADMSRPRPASRRRAVKRLVMRPVVREPLGERASNRLTAKPAGQGVRGRPATPTPGRASVRCPDRLAALAPLPGPGAGAGAEALIELSERYGLRRVDELVGDWLRSH
jgi:hypothetical protein